MGCKCAVIPSGDCLATGSATGAAIQVPAGRVFDIGGIPCMKCSLCGVTRELQHFWSRGASKKPAASVVKTVCTYCC